MCVQYCQICRKGDNEDLLLLCDGCDKGCHTYCHKPKIFTIPEGDWYCPSCITKVTHTHTHTLTQALKHTHTHTNTHFHFWFRKLKGDQTYVGQNQKGF